ncbi:thioesterase family protein [Neptunicella marina]|uniref:Thioesterase n=1 Tax=Neptunicella marina TaxID=2125989 RepID=A0A8J6ITW3_9ALTE|nr:hotdog domain-containing protein [Neptunicella marina]MBC3766244.1 thioesterase [Neptunicella marina]
MRTGDKAEIVYQVTHADTAKALSFDPQDNFPSVLATARMVALMELAAARVLKPQLQAGELSVGIDVNVKHMAATAVDDTVTARAEYTGPQGKLHGFNVYLYDSGGLAGEGTHTRAIIDSSRLEDGAQKRASKS